MASQGKFRVIPVLRLYDTHLILQSTDQDGRVLVSVEAHAEAGSTAYAGSTAHATPGGGAKKSVGQVHPSGFVPSVVPSVVPSFIMRVPQMDRRTSAIFGATLPALFGRVPSLVCVDAKNLDVSDHLEWWRRRGFYPLDQGGNQMVRTDAVLTRDLVKDPAALYEQVSGTRVRVVTPGAIRGVVLPKIQREFNHQIAQVAVESNSEFEATETLTRYFSDPALYISRGSRRGVNSSGSSSGSSRLGYWLTNRRRLIGMDPARARKEIESQRGLPSLFPVAAAKWIYETLGSERVFDPFAGWGDRLLAASMVPSVETYDGVDVNRYMKPIYQDIIEFVHRQSGNRSASSDAKHASHTRLMSVSTMDILDWQGRRMSYDTVLTSPPFYDHELYSPDDRQSTSAFRSQESWLRDFMFPVVEKVYLHMKPGGAFVIYITDTGRNAYTNQLLCKLNTLFEYGGFITLPKFPAWVFYKTKDHPIAVPDPTVVNGQRVLLIDDRHVVGGTRERFMGDIREQMGPVLNTAKQVWLSSGMEEYRELLTKTWPGIRWLFGQPVRGPDIQPDVVWRYSEPSAPDRVLRLNASSGEFKRLVSSDTYSRFRRFEDLIRLEQGSRVTSVPPGLERAFDRVVGRVAGGAGECVSGYVRNSYQPVIPRVFADDHCRETVVLTEEHLIGGTKERVLSKIMAEKDTEEFIYVGPPNGFTQVAMVSIATSLGKKSRVFTASPSPETRLAERLGATVVYRNAGMKELYEMSETYMTRVSGDRTWDNKRVYRIPFGADDPVLARVYVEELRKALEAIPAPKRLWITAGSGMLTRALQTVWPSTSFQIVQVGRDVPDDLVRDTDKLYVYPRRFLQPAAILPPYSSPPTYDAKAYSQYMTHGSKGDYIWNTARRVEE